MAGRLKGTTGRRLDDLGSRGVRADKTGPLGRKRLSYVFVVLEADGQEAGELARAGPVEAVPGDARWDVFAGAPRGWLGHAKVDKPAYPVYNTEADEGWLRSPLRSP